MQPLLDLNLCFVRQNQPAWHFGGSHLDATLDLLVSDWLDGVDLARRHGPALAHLRLCAACQREFETLAELLCWAEQPELQFSPGAHIMCCD